MPDPITITEGETTAVSPEQTAAEQTNSQDQALIDANEARKTSEPATQSKLAGKYGSVEELEKGYLELQKKSSGQAEDVGETESNSEDKPETTGTATEIYGDYIGSRLDESNVDYQGMNTRWQETGSLTNEDYTSLENAGFTKDMVEAYLDGVQFRASQDSQIAAKEVTAIKDEFGGEETYQDMVKFAQANWDRPEIEAFDNMLKTSNPHQIRIAVAGLQASYLNNAPREPQLVGGRAARQDSTRFESPAQVVAAMNDPKYKEDPAYRKEVQEKLGRSNVM